VRPIIYENCAFQISSLGKSSFNIYVPSEISDARLLMHPFIVLNNRRTNYSYSSRICDGGILIQLLCFCILSIALFLFKTHLGPNEQLPLEEGKSIQSQKCCVLNKNGIMDNVQKAWYFYS
jgi:hypothetical protein